jgi:hypothetical protein
MVETGANKAVLPVWRQLQLGVLAGVCVSLGAFLALSISGNNPALSASHPGLYRLLFGAFGRAPWGQLRAPVGHTQAPCHCRLR